MKDLFDCARRELGRRPRRTLATISGFLLTAFLLFVLGSLLGSARQGMDEILTKVGTHIVVCVPASPEEVRVAASGPWPLDSLNEAFYADPNVVTLLLPRSLANDLKKQPAILAVAPLILYRMKNAEGGFLFSIAGFDPKDALVLPVNLASEKDIVSGTFIRSGDRGVAVVEEGYAITAGLKVGSVIKMSGIAFPVIGIIKPGIQTGKADVLVTMEDAVAIINPRLREPIADQVNAFLVEVRQGQLMDEAIGQIRKVIPGCLVNTFFCSVSAITVLGMHEGAALLLLGLVFFGMTLLALSSQWASVVERRRDIGILKAIGWSDRQVVGELGMEGVLQAFVGGLAGCALGCLFLAILPLPEWVTSNFSWNVSRAVVLFFASMAVSLASGLIAGIIPAFLAARQSPAAALRES